MRTKAPAEKKVGSTELAETLPKFNYNQYLVDKRVSAKTIVRTLQTNQITQPKSSKSDRPLSVNMSPVG